MVNDNMTILEYAKEKGFDGYSDPTSIQSWLRNMGVIVLVTLREVDEGDFRFSYQVFEPSSIYYHHPPLSSTVYWNMYEEALDHGLKHGLSYV
ncbi:hypothetical protein CHU00_10810 [Sphingobacterium cellulitidis]|uniref:hypothetical protein n=1 Tax=Sphingobacterium cellulitidis TaxID=1768011 RepID=UPI000B93FF3A|nr:hypothetical protein [Sphingobacterium cellulitidis]OYD40741.1 hypothetical protein CHT99_17200 [Sphingobacterium cellulitidis]OYD45451.1 hypothetical protein CHU00_10810 [Sphingobacterium cellulitidis]